MGKIVPTEIARAIAAQRKRGPVTCAQCGKVFEGTTRARYCSANCRVKANYLAHADERKADRRARYQRTKVPASK